MSQEHAWTVDEIARELDMVVFQLEQGGDADVERLRAERREMRRQLEQLRDRLQDLARAMS